LWRGFRSYGRMSAMFIMVICMYLLLRGNGSKKKVRPLKPTLPHKATPSGRLPWEGAEGRTRPRGGPPRTHRPPCPQVGAERGEFRGISRVSAPRGREGVPWFGRGVARLCASAPDRHRLPRLTPRPVGPLRPMGLRLARAPAARRAVARAVAPAWPALRVDADAPRIGAVCHDSCVGLHCRLLLSGLNPSHARDIHPPRGARFFTRGCPSL